MTGTTPDETQVGLFEMTSSDEDHGPRPVDLYGEFTWKINNFSQVNERELRSAEFQVGSYNWYLLLYPQGCDVNDNISLFLCVANHDNLTPGWNHLAQFTIKLMNNDPRKSKTADTLHRFWKKEHDWGWKKIMEHSRLEDGFVNDDTLVIQAHVQVIRERSNRLFRCLAASNCMKELVSVYLKNVEQIFHGFLETTKNKLGIFIQDKATWSSFRAFWIAIDQRERQQMCREKTDYIFKAIMKQFFLEKEITSTIVMDSLYNGLKFLQGQSKGEVESKKLPNSKKFPAPIVHIEKDMFILVDDVLNVLKRAVLEPLPPASQTPIKELGKEDHIDAPNERNLTELGYRTIQIFVLAHIFRKIEIAYRENIVLEMQNKLILEDEEAASKQKAKHGASKKKRGGR